MTSNYVFIRDYDPISDKALIYDSWLKGNYYGNSWFEEIDNKAYRQNYRIILDRLTHASQIHVACLVGFPDIILGYVVFQNPGLLHWIFVKSSWRKKGIAARLLKDLEISTVTHLTEVGKKLKPEAWIFNPFLI